MKLSDLRVFVENMEDLESKLFYARFHIKKNIQLLPPNEVRCLMYDGVLSEVDIPEEVRQKMVQVDPHLRHVFERFAVEKEK